MISGERLASVLHLKSLHWVLFVYFQEFLDDYRATAAESLLKHALLRAKGRVALRRLGSSTACSHNNRDHHDLLGDETSSVSSPISCKNKDGDENKNEGIVVVGPKSAADSPVASNDMGSGNSYDEEDDAFDDSNTDDDTERALSTDPSASAPTISPKGERPTTPAVPPINRMARHADESTAATTRPPASLLVGDDPKAGPRQQPEQQQQQQASAVLTTPSAAHTGIATTPRTSSVSSMAMASEEGGSNTDGDISAEEQQGVAHPTGGSGEIGCGDESGKSRKQAVPLSARR